MHHDTDTSYIVTLALYYTSSYNLSNSSCNTSQSSYNFGTGTVKETVTILSIKGMIRTLYVCITNSYQMCYISCLVLNVGNDGGAVGALAALFTVSFFIIILLLITLLICTVTLRKLKSKLHSQEATGTAIIQYKGTVNQYSTYYAVIDLYLFLSSCSGFPEDYIASIESSPILLMYMHTILLFLCSCCIERSSLLHIIIQIHLIMKPFIVKEMGGKPEQKR